MLDSDLAKIYGVPTFRFNEAIKRNRHRFPADLGTSILADRQGNRPLEWDCRNGVVQRCGRSHGIPTPISDLVVPLLAAASDGPG